MVHSRTVSEHAGTRLGLPLRSQQNLEHLRRSSHCQCAAGLQWAAACIFKALRSATGSIFFKSTSTCNPCAQGFGVVSGRRTKFETWFEQCNMFVRNGPAGALQNITS